MGPQPQTSKITKILIFAVGLLVGGALVSAYFSFYADGTDKSAPQVTTETEGILLSISSPGDGFVVSEKNLPVSGTTGKDSVVVITGGVEDKIVETSQGSFSTNIEIAEGQNQVAIYAFDISTGENVQALLDVLYISEKLAARNLLIASEHTNIEEKIDTIKERLSTQSADLKSGSIGLPKSHVLGTIVSKGKSAFSLETSDTGIKTVFIDDLTKFSVVETKSTSTSNFEALEVGDNVSVAGISIEDSMGTAKFVIKMGKKTSKHHAIVGRVKEINQDKIVLADLGQKDLTFSIKTTKSSVVSTAGNTAASVSDIKGGDILVVSGTIDKQELITATKIFIKSTKSTQKESTKSATPSAK